MWARSSTIRLARRVENPEIFKTDSNGHSIISIFGAMRSINAKIATDIAGLHGIERARKEREDIGLFQKAFGIQGARFGYMATPEGINQLLGLVKQLGQMPGIDKTQSSFMANFSSQVPRTWGNFQSLLTELGTLALPGATKGVKDLGDALHFAQAWLHQHAALERKIQKAVIDGVVGTEKYLVAHKKDWEIFGNDILYFGKEVHDAAPMVLTLADAIGKLYQQAKMFGDDLNKISTDLNNNGKWFHDNIFGKSDDNKPGVVASASYGDYGGGGKVSPGSPGRLSSADISRKWMEAGSDPRYAYLMGHVGFEESAGNAKATNSYVERGKRRYVHGVFQISDVNGPDSSIHRAVQLFNDSRGRGGTGLEPWADSQNKGATGGWAQYVGGSPPPSVAATHPHARQHVREIHHVVDIRGGTEHAKIQLRRAVREVFEEESHGSDPRHHVARSGTIHTSAHQPTIHVTPAPPR